MQAKRQHRTLQAIAVFEAIKGVLTFLLLLGIFSLLHHDIRHIALNIIGHFGLEPTQHYPMIFLHWIDVVNDINKLQLFLLSCAYVSIRFFEAYGLWHEREWAEWLAALSGGIYMPFEAMHMWRAPSWSSILVFIFNALMVGFLVLQLWKKRQPTH